MGVVGADAYLSASVPQPTNTADRATTAAIKVTFLEIFRFVFNVKFLYIVFKAPRCWMQEHFNYLFSTTT